LPNRRDPTDIGAKPQLAALIAILRLANPPIVPRGSGKHNAAVSAIATPENRLPATELQNRGIEETQPNNPPH
jgi:hypothetical protein